MDRADASLSHFNPLIANWFGRRYGAPTEVQRKAWPLIADHCHILMTAPTGSGKTLSAFLWGLNQLIEGMWTPGVISILYVSPLRALNNDIRTNLLQPLNELKEQFIDHGGTFPDIHVQTRSGDTPASDRQRMLRHPPEILITTPESLNILLSSPSGRDLLTHIQTVILDEIHAVASNKRGTHLITAVERLVPLSGEFQRIALSATVKPLKDIADFIGGYRREGNGFYKRREVSIVQAASAKRYDIRVRSAAHADQAQGPDGWWQSLVEALRDRIEHNRATLLFANSRRFTEKLTRLINASDSADARTAYSHHGSLSREIRHLVEDKLKKGELKSIVATSSLELGIDIGELDEVILVQAPLSVSSALQRVGRAGHGVEEVSRAALFPLFSRDYLNGAVIARAVVDGDIETARIPMCPLDVLAQIIISMTGVESLTTDELYDLVRASYPYQGLRRDQFDLVVQMLAGNYEESKIRELRPRISIDPVTGTVRSREGSLRVLYMAGGTIPDRGYYTLRVAGSGAKIGELDEEFVWERSIGDVFTFGTQQWCVLNIDHQNVEVAAVSKQASMAPFWKADLNGRDFHLSEKIALFLEELDEYEHLEHAIPMLTERYFMDETSTERLISYLAAQRDGTATGLPHRHRIIVEHIPGLEDRSDSRQIVVHAIWGGRVLVPYAVALGQAWEDSHGSSLRIYHDNDTMLIALPAGAPVPSVRELLTLVTPDNVEGLLRKKLEQTGLFGALFRQNASVSLLLPKRGFNRRTPLWLNRIRSRKLLQSIFHYADFPVLTETWRSCLQDVFDMPSLKSLVLELEQGDIDIVECFPQSPSPFAAEIIHWQTHTHMYEDDTPGVLTESSLSDIILREAVFTSSLRPCVSQDIIDFIGERLNRCAAGYTPDSVQSLYDWLQERLLLPGDEAQVLASAMVRDHGTEASTWFGSLSDRVAELTLPGASIPSLVALENLKRILQALYTVGDDGEDLLVAPLSQWLRYYGPLDQLRISDVWGMDAQRLGELLETMVEERIIVRDRFRVGDERVEICDAENLERLLRIQRSKGRREFKPIPLRLLQLFLAQHQHLIPGNLFEDASEFAASGSDAANSDMAESATSGSAASSPDIAALQDNDNERQLRHLKQCLEQLFGYPARAEVWECAIFPSRMKRYNPGLLDLLFQQSDLLWFGTEGRNLSFCLAPDRVLYLETGGEVTHDAKEFFPDPAGKYDYWDIQNRAKTDNRDLSLKLWDLVWRGVISNDRFEPVRRGSREGYGAFPEAPIRGSGRHIRHRMNRWMTSHPMAGNWFVINPEPSIHDLIDEEELSRERVRGLLARYGVLFRDLLLHELPQLRWGAIFRSLRLMELSGELLAGYFFEGIPGLQFASHSAFQELVKPLPADAVYWMCATDPASLCGVRIEGMDIPLPRRVSSNYIVFRGERPVLSLGRNGSDVFVHVPVQDEHMGRYLRIFEILLNRSVNPLAQVKVETINEKPSLESEYRGRFIEFGFTKGHRGLMLRRVYR